MTSPDSPIAWAEAEIELSETAGSPLDSPAAKALLAFVGAVDGDDEEAPEIIRPLSWLKEAIQTLNEIPHEQIEDLSAHLEMIGELQELFDRSSYALALTKGEKP